jgi:hypothetical protein
MKHIVASIIGVAIVAAASSYALAVTQVYVSQTTGSDLTGVGSKSNPWATIGKAIDSVSGSPGNPYEILVAQGAYVECELHMDDYESILGGYSPLSWERAIDTYQTIIDASEGENGLWGAQSVTIEGLYIQNAAERGIFCFSSSPVIAHCRISNCGNMGISTAEGAVIRDNILENNKYGIFCGDNPGFTTRIENNLILSSRGTAADAICSVSNNMICINSTIDSNDKGIWVQKYSSGESPTVVIQNNNVTRNASVLGYGIYLFDWSNQTYGVNPALVTIRSNNVWGNDVNYHGGAQPGEGDISQDPMYCSPLAFAPGAVPGTATDINAVVREDMELIAQKDINERLEWERGYSSGKRKANPERSMALASASNYRLAAGSPSIDAGNNSGAPSDDLEGKVRPNPNTGVADIGGSEYYASVAAGLDSADYDGNGTSDIGIYRPSEGKWAIRNVTLVYFGGVADAPIAADYNGDGTSDIAIFRPSQGMWSVRNLTRVYLGNGADSLVPGDYSGNGTAEVGIFRSSAGMWSIRNTTRIYFGNSTDRPAPGDFNGDGKKEAAIFRPSTILWSVWNVTRFYFGSSADAPMPGDYDGNGTCDGATFRASSGMWSIRNITRWYMGNSTDSPVTADFNGTGRDQIGSFRDSAKMWSVRNVTRVYFGGSGDIPVTR